MSTYELQPGAIIELLEHLPAQVWNESFTETTVIEIRKGTVLVLGLVHWPGDAIIKALIDQDPDNPERHGLFVSVQAEMLKGKYAVVWNQMWLPRDVDLHSYWHRMLLARALSVYAEWLSVVPKSVRPKIKRLLRNLTEEKISIGDYIKSFHVSIEKSAASDVRSTSSR